MTIAEIQVEAVRGIRREVALCLGGQSALIIGDNGTGKTSLVRALMWALRGEEEPDSNTSLEAESSFRRHVLEPVGAPRVRLTLAPTGVIEVRPGTLNADETGLALRTSSLRSSPFLVRRQLLEILAARPIDRFRYLESFLDVEGADAVWIALSRRATELREQTARDAARASAEVQGISATLPEPDAASCTSWPALHDAIRRRLTTLGLALRSDAGWDATVAAAEQAGALAEPEQLERRRSQLVAAAAVVAELREALSEPVAGDVVAVEARRAELVADLTDAGLVDLIEHARRHFVASDTHVACPVCGNRIDRTDLLASLEQRIAALRDVEAVRGQLHQAAQEWATRWQTFLDLCRRLAAALGLRALNEIGGRPAAPPSAAILAQSSTANLDAFLSRLLVSDPHSLESWMQELVRFVAAHVSAAQEALPSAGAAAELRAIAATVRRAAAAMEQIRLLESRARDAQLQADRLVLVSEAVRRARQDYARRTLDTIADRVRDYYLAIHPPGQEDEATGPPRITVKRQREGTAYIQGSFNRRDVPDPRWVYSDGHLDTVGICVFLALRRHRADLSGDHRLIVFDDIVLSVDLTHARRLIVLLQQQFTDHQIIVFTHNALFAHWYEGLVSGLRRYRITGWSLEAGPQMRDHEGTQARLERVIVEATDAKEVGQAIQALMDEWLHEARFVYGLSIPAQRGEQYTMAEIWAPFAAMVRRVLRALGRDADDELPMLTRLADLPRVRNSLAAHENEFAREFPLETIRTIARDVTALLNRLHCADCRTLVEPIPNARQASIMHCRCRTKQFLPAPAQGPSSETAHR